MLTDVFFQLKCWLDLCKMGQRLIQDSTKTSNYEDIIETLSGDSWKAVLTFDRHKKATTAKNWKCNLYIREKKLNFRITCITVLLIIKVSLKYCQILETK